MDVSQLGLFCSLGKTVFGSGYSIFWSILTFLGFWKSLGVLFLLILWVIFELITKNGGVHYNSDNGFSPAFNIFVGASTYFWLQTFLYSILEKLFGQMIYCVSWPYILHVLVFTLTGLFLCLIGFWNYWRPLGIGFKIRIR